MGVDEGVAVGDVLLPASGLPFLGFLGVVVSVELPDGDCLGVVLVPAVKLVDTLLVLVLFVCGGVAHHYATHKADADECAEA